MNAFDKINPETSDLLEGEVIVLEAPVKPKRDERIPEGAEVVKAEIVYGSCRYFAHVSNKDGSHVSRQHVDGNIERVWGGGSDHGSNTGFFIASHNGMNGPSSSHFTLLSSAPIDLRW